MKSISVEQVIKIHSRLLAQTGGEDGLRDKGLLESAILSPQQTFGSRDIYPTTVEKAAQTAFLLIRNHPFVDGNKRVGIHVMLLLLLINDETVSATDDEKINLGMNIAKGLSNPDDILNWLNTHMQK